MKSFNNPLTKKEKSKLQYDVKNYISLKILSYDKDFENRKKLIKDSAGSSLLKLVFLIFLIIGIISVTTNNFESSKLNILEIFIVSLILVFFLFVIHFLFEFLNLQLLTKIKRFIFLVLPFEFWLLSSSLWLLPVFIKNGHWIYNNCVLNIIVFILGAIITFYQVKKVVDYFPNYLYDSIDNLTSDYALPISSIVTLIYGPQIISPESIFQLFTSWGLVLIIGTVTIISIKFKNKSEKNNSVAQKIFEVQLLSDNPDYEELKKCYYYGGEKYKEKLLSNEKFLKVIMASEIGLLNVMETYEDYKLYKAFNYKSYLESQK
ncbi:hypothetical protein [Streptococcus anginosus]|uniref:hypothetical protein n=1 Tax=Streptococcus anginosus TaxID=1328 RepID=UPI00115C93BC|nr:hypothetical protein [Streptococcus anginosus]